MHTEYNDILKRVSVITGENLGDKEEEYLKKYFLTEYDYLNNWKDIKNSIFSLGIDYSSAEFIRNDYDITQESGGVLLTEGEIEKVKEIMKRYGDRNFVVVEDADNNSRFQFKYPNNITWEEINSGGEISYELYGRPIRNYFIYGDTGKWAMYVANDEDEPVVIIATLK